jgi:hypothetical protein
LNPATREVASDRENRRKSSERAQARRTSVGKRTAGLRALTVDDDAVVDAAVLLGLS